MSAPDNVEGAAKGRRWRRLRRAAMAVLAVAVTPVALFAFNGLVLARGERPVVGTTSHPAGALTEQGGFVEVRIVAYNIAKGFAHLGGTSFADREVVAGNIRRMAQAVAAVRPDFVFLSEAIKECALSPVDQVTTLAEATGMHSWVFGENYNFGLPFCRIVGGNAILSRLRLEPVANPSLAGRQPFWVTKNNRRVLFAAARIAGERVMLGAMHTDSYDLANNLRQTRQVLAFVGTRPTVLAGDFNAQPHEPSIHAVRDSGRFHGSFEGPPTFPGDRQRIDFVLAPTSWELVEERVLETDASDHRPVFARFRVPLR